MIKMFRHQKSVKKLSAEELKSKLYAHFDKSGSLNQLRTQLRGQLISELFKIAPPQTHADVDAGANVGMDKTLLPLQVCNWLIYDHLLRQGCHYSLSTFVSETNSPNLDKFLTAGDIIALFGLDSSTQEFKKISELYSSNSKKGHSHSLLLAIIKSLLNAPNKESKEDEMLLNEGDLETEEKLAFSHESINKTSHEKIIDETVRKTEMELHGDGINETMESTFNKQLLYVKEEKEKEIQKLRHKLLDELERLHSQERSLHMEIDQERREIRRERDMLFSDKDKLKEKELLFIKEQENIFEKKLREMEELHTAKLYSREKDLEILTKKLLDREQKLGQMEFELSTHKERFDALKRELDDINHMYKVLHEKYNNLLDENTNLVKKFEKMSDYNTLKEELTKKSNEISNLEQEVDKIKRIAENDRKNYKETVTNLELKLRTTEPKIQQIQRELNTTRDTLHMEEAVWNKERKKLEQESVTTKELYRTVLQRIEEQKQDIQDLHQTIHILHYQLTNKDVNHSRTKPYEPVGTINKMPYLASGDVRTSNSNKNNPINLSQQYRKDALNFTAEYKSRLNKLQQEVDAGFDKYSLIYCSSLNSNISSTKFTQPSALSNSAKTNILSSTKYFPSISRSYQMESITGTLPSMDLTFKSSNNEIPYSMNKTAFRRSETNASMMDLQGHAKNFEADYQTNDRYDTLTSSKYANTPFTASSQMSLVDRNSKPKSDFTAESQFVERSHVTPVIKNVTFSEKLVLNEMKEDFSSEIHKSNIPNVNSMVNKDVSHINFCNPSAELLPSTNIANTTLPETSAIKTISTQSDEKSSHNSKIKEDFGSDTLPSSVVTSGAKTVPNFQESAHIGIEIHSSKHKVQNFNEASEIQPSISDQPEMDESVVVDLDAVWKRKSSLPPVSVPLLQRANLLERYSKDLITQDQDEEILSVKTTSKNEEKPKRTDLSVQIPDAVEKAILSPNRKDVPESSTSNLLLDQRFSETIFNAEIISTSNHTKNNQVDYLKRTSSDPSDKMQNNENVSDSVEKQDFNENENKLRSVENVISSDEDVKAKENTTEINLNRSYQRHDDSLSELSEVHMSCGSEQEEKKEESDNW